MATWEAKNPNWERILWTDRSLLDFVAEFYPDFLPIYTQYPKGIMRADAARYMLLHHFGGVYVDLDCECIRSLDSLITEDRIVVSREPVSHEVEQVHWRGLPYLLFNGTIASPANHPFWPHLLKYLEKSSHSEKDVLDITGPCIFTSAQLSFEDQKAFSIHDPYLFTPIDRDGKGDQTESTLSVHHWAGTWWQPARKAGWFSIIKTALYKAIYWITRGPQFDPRAIIQNLTSIARNQLPPQDGKVAIFIPIRNAADHLMPLGDLLTRLDYPKDRLRIAFCEGDSTDLTRQKLDEFKAKFGDNFADISVLTRTTGNKLNSAERSKPKKQRLRRSNIAKVRNHLIEESLRSDDDWVLWLDADVCAFPTDIIQRLLAAQAKIVAPNCVKTPSGPSFDLNSFVTRGLVKNYRYFRAIKQGIYQPPANIDTRYHLSDLTHLPSVPLDSVGGCMLLVDASLHRAGLIFPEEPYDDLIETEAFGALANHCTIQMIGLPQTEIRHVLW